MKKRILQSEVMKLINNNDAKLYLLSARVCSKCLIYINSLSKKKKKEDNKDNLNFETSEVSGGNV